MGIPRQLDSYLFAVEGSVPLYAIIKCLNEDAYRCENCLDRDYDDYGIVENDCTCPRDPIFRWRISFIHINAKAKPADAIYTVRQKIVNSQLSSLDLGEIFLSEDPGETFSFFNTMEVDPAMRDIATTHNFNGEHCFFTPFRAEASSGAYMTEFTKILQRLRQPLAPVEQKENPHVGRKKKAGRA